MVQAGVGEIRGREDVLAAMAMLDGGFTLTWDPYRAEIAAAGDMGYTVGRWTSEQPDGVTTHGVYVSIWRRQPDGTWKVTMDLGNPVGDGPWPEGG
jgi:ketosteroid isomerase-like protein